MKFRSRANNKPSAIISLDLTPMVDVVFNLLIFFALSLNFAVTSGGINVKLPTASSAKKVTTKNISINIKRDGSIYYNKKLSSLKQIRQILNATTDKKPLIVIRADEQVKHGLVVAVMDAIKSEGFSKLAVAAQNK